ncbi:hypothetical protein ACFFX0_15550 [Citricoccus parietis]|uniref:Uncharacterized protein n=1 Tax=Citricoccus parietis TaxID=592307 RepID=A0ABV5G0S8_9MICC
MAGDPRQARRDPDAAHLAWSRVGRRRAGRTRLRVRRRHHAPCRGAPSPASP